MLRMKKYINWLAYLSLAIAFVIGYIGFGDNEKRELIKMNILAENKLQLEEFDTDTYNLFKNDTIFGYLSIGEAQGYGGPLRLVVVADTMGTILGTELIESFETVSFLAKLENNKYYDQYPDKLVNDRIELNRDIDAVSGATVSSGAIAQAVREASHTIAIRRLHLEVPQIESQWSFGRKEGIISLLFLLAVVGVFLKKKYLRYVSLFLSLVFIGFVFNASLSLTHFGRIFLGYFPDIHSHFIWWLLMFGTLTILIGWGKNVYCSSLCPFHASQILLHKVSGINIKLPKKLAKLLAQTPYFLLWVSLLIIFVSANPTIASYEPFAMLFSLDGVGIQWYILPASLIGAMFFSDFFCRFFCPVGGALRWGLKIRTKVKAIIFN